jgi:hypothetical protein
MIVGKLKPGIKWLRVATVTSGHFTLEERAFSTL